MSKVNDNGIQDCGSCGSSYDDEMKGCAEIIIGMIVMAIFISGGLLIYNL